MTVTLEMIFEKLVSMEKELKETTQEVKELKTDISEFKTEMYNFRESMLKESDRVFGELQKISRQTAFNTEKVDYLAGKVGQHDMVINIISKQ